MLEHAKGETQEFQPAGSAINIFSYLFSLVSAWCTSYL